MVDASRKRKLQVEQFGLPEPKHKSWDHHSSPKPLLILENQESEDSIAKEVAGSSERPSIEDGSDLESGKDSNSFVGDSVSFMSVCGAAKFETEVSKPWPSSGTSSSSLLNQGQNNNKDIQCCLNGTTATSTSGTDKNGPGELDLVEPIIEFTSHFDYSCSQDGIDSIEPYIDKELDDNLYSNGVNPNMYVLSSGRWSVNQDAEPGTRKPTIDQEFEQYFSMLML